MTDNIEAMRLQTRRWLDDLVARVEAGDEVAIAVARHTVENTSKASPDMLADVLRGMIHQLDIMRPEIERRHKHLYGKGKRKP